jgi:hypothetical protein
METERGCSVPCICVFEAGNDAVNSSQVQWRLSSSVALCCVPSLSTSYMLTMSVHHQLPSQLNASWNGFLSLQHLTAAKTTRSLPATTDTGEVEVKGGFQ